MRITTGGSAGRAQRSVHILPAHILGAFAVLAVLSACAGAGRDDTAVPSLQAAAATHANAEGGLAGDPDPNARIEFSGFSVLPPQGAHWVETMHAPSTGTWQTGIIFWKITPQTRPESVLHTVFALVRSTPVPAAVRQQLRTPEDRQAFMRQVMNTTMEKDRLAMTGRHRPVFQKAYLDRSLGYDCFKYDLVDEDRGVAGFEDQAFTVDLHAYTCLDPALSLVVQTMYSQRTPPGERPIDLGREGEDFLMSLLFSSQIGV